MFYAGTGVAADTAAGKIVELSKKNRELSADLQSDKNKVRQLTRKVQDLEYQVSRMKGGGIHDAIFHVMFQVMCQKIRECTVYHLCIVACDFAISGKEFYFCDVACDE